MRHALLVLGLLAGLLAAPAGASAAGVKVLACGPALDPLARSATFEAHMGATGRTARMQVRFTLQTRTDAEPAWRTLPAPGFDAWLRSAPGVRRYAYVRTVQNLAAPAAYRVTVRFRWLDARGHVHKRARRTSDACEQEDMRPDLRVTDIDVRPAADAARRRYVVTVRNAGRTDAGPFGVALRAGGAEPLWQLVPALAAGASADVVFGAPGCDPGAMVEATADWGGAVDERREDDNVLFAPCS